MIRFRKKILPFLKSFKGRALILPVVLALSLWFYANMNLEFVSFVVIPLELKIPVDRAVESKMPTSISVEVKGSGWQLFNLQFFNTSAKCIIDLSRFNITDSVLEISRNDIIKSIQTLNNVQAIDVVPQNLKLITGRTGEISIPIINRVIVKPKEDFTIVGNIELKPDMINISGNEKLLSKIKSWQSQKIVLDKVYKNLNESVLLADSLKNIIKMSQNHVRLIADIQQSAVIPFYDLKIKYKGGNLPANHIITPNFVTIYVSGGVNQLSDINYDMFNVYLNTDEVLTDSTGVLIPEIEAPPGLKILKIDPPYVYHDKRIKS